MRNSKPNCAELRPLLALSVGGDLDLANQRIVEQHLAECSKCREHWAGLREGQTVLKQLAATDRVEQSRSLWPSIKGQLTVVPQVLSPRPFSWFPAAVLAAACVLLVAFSGLFPFLVGTTNIEDESLSWRIIPPMAQPVSHSVPPGQRVEEFPVWSPPTDGAPMPFGPASRQPSPWLAPPEDPRSI